MITRKLPRRAGLVVAVLALVAAFTGSLSAASASSAATRSLNFVPLVGNGTYLVYSQSTAGCTFGYPTLHVRTANGTTWTLPLKRDDNKYSDGANPCNGQLRLTGHLLTLEGIAGGSREPIYWWDLRAHTHGRTLMPDTDLVDGFIGTVPGGWIFIRNNAPGSDTHTYTATTLFREGTGGKVTTYGTFAPFQTNHVAIGTRGIVLGNGSEGLRYLPFGASTPKVLDSPAHRYTQGGGCDAVTSTYAACNSQTYNDPTGQVYTYEQSLTPLDGGATIANATAFAPQAGGPGYSADSPAGVTILLTTGDATTLRTLHLDGSVSSGHGHGAVRTTVAYGEIIVGHTTGRVTEQSSVTSAQHTILHD